MSDPELVVEILGQVLEATKRIERRFATIRNPEDFLASDDGLDRLDGIGMMVIAIGESLKNLDKVTEDKLLPDYPDVDWKGAKGVRDVISHQYFDINPEIVFGICQKDIPLMAATVQRMIKDLQSQ